MANYYKPSGKTNLSSVAYFILCSAIILPILALIYTYLVWYIPIIYINFIVTIGFGFGIGIATNFFVIKLGKVRNPLVGAIYGFAGSLVALYFSWGIWVDLVINAGESYGGSRIGITASNIRLSQVIDLILNPDAIHSLATEINKYGTWGIRSATVSGVFLYVIWAIEALIVAVIPAFLNYLRAKVPFCEFDNKWYDETILPAFNYIENPLEMVKNIESYNKEAFSGLELETKIKEGSHSLFSLYTSKRGTNYLTIQNKKSVTNKKGEKEFEDNEFVEYISLNPELKDVLLNIK